MDKTALYIGRFQPFHNGHLGIIQKILKKNDYLIIVIGSAENYGTPENPLTAGERFQLIDAALSEAKINQKKYCIIPARDIENYANWARHIDIHVPPYQTLYTGSEMVKQCYKNHPETKIIEIPRKPPISGTSVRLAILKDQDWEKLVPKSVAKLLNKWNTVELIKRLG